MQNESIQIYLNSRYATQTIDDNTANCVYFLPVIEIEDGHHIYLTLVSAQIPYSFYSITSVDNTFEFGLVGAPSPTVYNVPAGNYTITQIIDLLKSAMGANYNITYSTTTSKLLFTHTTSNFTIYANTFNHAIGFSKTTNTTSQGNILYARDVCNLNQIRALNIECNFPTGNINVAQSNNLNILATIPVYVAPFSIINYQNPNGFKTNLYINKLDQIQIRIIDNDGRLIDLNGINYQMLLQLDCVKFTE
jgi:hypothetical protein